MTEEEAILFTRGQPPGEIRPRIPMTEPLSDEALWDALDGLHAYDDGAHSSGIHDEMLRERVKTQLRAMTAKDRAKFLGRSFRDAYLTDRRLDEGYGLEDAAKFWDWLVEDMGCAL